jgi:hypothetical protein
VFDFANDLPPGVRCAVQVRSRLCVAQGRSAGCAQLGVQHRRAVCAGAAAQVYQRIDEEQFFALQLNGPATPASVQANVWCAVDGLGERVPVRLIDGAARTALLQAQGWDKAAAKEPQRYVARWRATGA